MMTNETFFDLLKDSDIKFSSDGKTAMPTAA